MSDDDFICGVPNGEILTKAPYLAEITSGDYQVTSMREDALKVRVYGDMALVTCIWTEKSQSKGADASGQYCSTDTWVKRDGRWQCVAEHISKIEEKSIEGIWVLEKANHVEPIDLEKQRCLKAYDNGAFFVTVYDRESGKVEANVGGTYSFDGRTLKEKVTFVGGEETEGLLGQTPIYNIEFKDGKIHQTGQLFGMEMDELWHRVGK